MTTKKLDRRTWLHHARAWKKSGMTCADYAKREGLQAAYGMCGGSCDCTTC